MHKKRKGKRIPKSNELCLNHDFRWFFKIKGGVDREAKRARDKRQRERIRNKWQGERIRDKRERKRKHSKNRESETARVRKKIRGM